MLSSLRKRLLDNSVMVNAPAEPSPLLTHIPWKLQFVDGSDTTTTTNGNNTAFPTPSYLNLRHQQNEAWAEERLVQGVAWAKSREWKKAEHAYKQGLEVLPDHANLLTAYGALLANRGYTDQALEMLEKALKVDPSHEQAKLYRDTLLRRLSGKEEERVVAAKAETSEITQENDNTNEEAQEEGDEKASAIHIKTSKEDPGTRGYSLVEENPPCDDSELSSKERKRKRKHKKKRRRKYESDSSSTDSESERRRRRRRKKEKKKRRKRKERKRRRRVRDSSEDESTASQDVKDETTAKGADVQASDYTDKEREPGGREKATSGTVNPGSVGAERQKRSKNAGTRDEDESKSSEEKECVKDTIHDNLLTGKERQTVEGNKPDESEGGDGG